ncbi:hypothetical protein M513_07855 [Trichuris suis]|uniref:WD repeat-containing protein 55 homolog n=1 Tax=Trichuris suis TaxID=68888 RepID=A0A085M209_9BILA|nr:hypothetical protein M513_07855 [Trichuris suis]
MHIVLGRPTGSVSMLNVGSMEDHAFVDLPCHSSVRAIAYAPDGQRIAVGCGDGTLHLVDIERSKVLTSHHTHSDRIWALKFSPDGSLLFSSSRDTTISAVAMTHIEPNLLISSSEKGVLMVYDFDKLARQCP